MPLVGTIILTDYDWEMLKERKTIYASFEPVPGFDDGDDEVQIDYMTEEQIEALDG